MKGKKIRSSDTAQSSPQTVKKIVKTSPGETATKVKRKPSSCGGEESDQDGNPTKDVMTFQRTCHSVQTIFEQMKALKDKNVDPEVC